MHRTVIALVLERRTVFALVLERQMVFALVLERRMVFALVLERRMGSALVLEHRTESLSLHRRREMAVHRTDPSCPIQRSSGCYPHARRRCLQGDFVGRQMN